MPGTTLPRGNILTNTMLTDELTPAEVAASTTAAQSFTVQGLAELDFVIGTSQDAQTAGVFIANCRVTADNTLEILFGNATTGAVTPVSGTYNFMVYRCEYNPPSADAS